MLLVATVNPSNATNKRVIWESGDKTIATVDAYGKVTALKVGTVTITVKTEDGSYTSTCTVKVKDDGKPNGSNNDFNVEKFDW